MRTLAMTYIGGPTALIEMDGVRLLTDPAFDPAATEYPTKIPLETFPPVLLRKLPDLPPELEYRIVNKNLILRDVKANLIVDILRGVVPTIPS